MAVVTSRGSHCVYGCFLFGSTTSTIYAALLLDIRVRAAGQRAGLRAAAVGDGASARRPAPAHGQHMHLSSLSTTLLIAQCARAKASGSDQHEDVWLRITFRFEIGKNIHNIDKNPHLLNS